MGDKIFLNEDPSLVNLRSGDLAGLSLLAESIGGNPEKSGCLFKRECCHCLLSCSTIRVPFPGKNLRLSGPHNSRR